MATYTDDQLTGIHFKNVNIELFTMGKTTYYFENLIINAPQDKYTYMQAFIWDSMQDIKPLITNINKEID